MDTKVYTSLCEEDTLALGQDLAERLRHGDIVAMYGDLGTGKTEFIRGVCTALGVSDLISSPTFTIINEYTGTRGGVNLQIYHIDLYRLESGQDLEEIGLPDVLIDPLSIKLVEWSEHAETLLPAHRYEVRLSQMDDEENGRSITVICPEDEDAVDSEESGRES